MTDQQHLILSVLVVLSALAAQAACGTRTRSITARHAAVHTTPRPSSNGSGTCAISAGSINCNNATTTTTTTTITPNMYAFDIAHGANAQQPRFTPAPNNNPYGPPYGNACDANMAAVMPPVADTHVSPSAPNNYEWMQPAVGAQGVLTNATAADCAAATTAVGSTGNAANITANAGGANGAAAGQAGVAPAAAASGAAAAAPAAAATAGAAGTRHHKLAEEGEATPFKWHVKTLVGDVLVWAALFTLLWGAAMPSDDETYADKLICMVLGGCTYAMLFVFKMHGELVRQLEEGLQDVCLPHLHHPRHQALGQ